MSMGARTAVISFPIKLVAGDVEGGKTADQDFDKEELEGAIDQAIDEAVEGAIDDASELLKGIDAETLESLTDFIKTTDKRGLQTLSKFAKNPSNMVQGELMGILGKAGIHGALAVAIISAIIATPEIIRTIVKAMSVKGAALNQDFNRFFEDEAQVGFSRELQYRRSTGLDVVITNDNRGFLLSDPGFVTNNLVDVESTRANRNSTNQIVYGYQTGM